MRRVKRRKSHRTHRTSKHVKFFYDDWKTKIIIYGGLAILLYGTAVFLMSVR